MQCSSAYSRASASCDARGRSPKTSCATSAWSPPKSVEKHTMTSQPIRFYQTGTFTVGNRLLPDEQRSVQANMRRTNSLNSGHRACQGCGDAPGCLEVFSTPYPETSWQIPWIHSLFGNAAAVATGIAAAMRVKGRHDVRVVAQGGDGGTADIGFGCLSGMFERHDDVLYLCYEHQ